MKEFASGLTSEDLKSGDWFTKLLAHALHQHRDRVDSEYFERRYPGMPRDAIVEARIKLAARYAALAGGLSLGTFGVGIAHRITRLGITRLGITRLGSSSSGRMPTACSASRARNRRKR